MIKVKKEPKQYRSLPKEHCVFCKKTTRYWTEDGSIPVCFICSRKHEPSELPTREEWLEIAE